MKFWFAPVAVMLLAAATPAQVTVDWVQPTRGVSIAVDAANNVFTADYEYALGAEISLTKRDVKGNLLWQASYDQTDSTKWEAATWVATDSQGNALVSGTLKSGYSNPVNAASILMKFSPNGTLLWRKVYESSFDGSWTKKCLVDASDNVYVLGMGSGPSAFVTKVKKFAPDGTVLWTYFDGAGIGAPINFKFTPDGGIVIAARAIFGSINGYAKIDLAGNEVWSRAGVQSLTVGDVAGDSLGNSYVVHGEYVLNGGSVIEKLDPAGNVLFDVAYGMAGMRIEVGSDDRAVISGFPNPNTAGAAFLKIDQAGNQLWANLDADGPLGLLLHAQMFLDESNDAYLAAGTLFDMAVCKVNADGTSAWTQTVAGSYANAMALARYDDSVFVVGGTTTRWLDAAEGPWTNFGKSKAGGSGVPHLYGQGPLTAGSPLTLTLAGAVPAAPALLVLGGAAANLPLLGGTLVPSPDFVLAGLVTDAAGGWQLASVAPAGLPAGFDVYLQAWLADPAAFAGAAASNGLRARTP